MNLDQPWPHRSSCWSLCCCCRCCCRQAHKHLGIGNGLMSNKKNILTNLNIVNKYPRLSQYSQKISSQTSTPPRTMCPEPRPPPNLYDSWKNMKVQSSFRKMGLSHHLIESESAIPNSSSPAYHLTAPNSGVTCSCTAHSDPALEFVVASSEACSGFQLKAIAAAYVPVLRRVKYRKFQG